MAAVCDLVSVGCDQTADDGEDDHAAEAVAAHDKGENGGALVNEPVGDNNGYRRCAGEERYESAEGTAYSEEPQALCVGIEDVVEHQKEIAENKELFGAEFAEEGLEEEHGDDKGRKICNSEVAGNGAGGYSGVSADLRQHHREA